MARKLTSLFGGTLVACGVLTAACSASAQVNLPFIEDFEGTNGETYIVNTASLAGAPEWGFSTDGLGRLRLFAGAGFANSGTHAATMDRNAGSTGFQVNLLTLTLDMTNYVVANDNIVLSFKAMHHGEENHANDRVWVRGSSADTFVQLADLYAMQGSSGNYVDFIDLDVSAALIGAAQQYSSTFQIRFGQEDDFSATTPSGTDGRSFDDIRLTRLVNDDIAVASVDTPAELSCGDPMQMVDVSIFNNGAVTKSNIPVQIEVTGDFVGSYSVMVPGPLARNDVGVISVGPIDTIAGGNIIVSATTNLVGDLDPANDNLTVTRVLRPTTITVATPDPICPGDMATIAVTPEVETSFSLYDVDVAGMPLDGAPDNLTAPAVTADTTFYIERENAVVAGAPLDNTIGGGAPYGTFTDGVTFDAPEPSIIEAVHVYPTTVGTVVVQLLDSGNTVLATSMPYAVVAADVGNKTRIDLDFAVPIGAGYRLDAQGTNTALYRNTAGAMYPYDINGWLTLTGNAANLPNSYYFFYDWQVSHDIPLCSNARTPVDVTVSNAACSADLVLAMIGSMSGLPGEEVNYAITVTNNGPTAAPNVAVDLPTPAGLTFVANAGDCSTPFACNLGTIASGDAAAITAKYTVDAAANGTLALNASVTSDAPEAAPGDEMATVNTVIMGGNGVGGGNAVGGGGPGVGGGGPGATAATTTGAGGGGGDEGDDAGCGCRTAPTQNSNSGLAWLAAGLAAVFARRRKSDNSSREGRV